MAWNSSKSSGDLITSADFNDRTTFMTAISTNRAWSTVSGATDITWNTNTFDGSGIRWNNATQKWIAVNVVAAGGGINNVVEDTTPQLGGALDGQDAYGVYDVTYISAQAFSGGKFGGSLLGAGDTQAASGSHTHTTYEAILASGNEYSWAYEWINDSGARLKSILNSGNEYTQAYNWYNTSSSKLSIIQASGNEFSWAYNWLNTSGSLLSGLLGSGNEYSWAYNWLNTSGSLLSNLLGSGNEYSWAHTWINQSGSQITAIIKSGNEYSAAYASAQATKELAYTDGDTIAGTNLTWNGTQLNATGGGVGGAEKWGTLDGGTGILPFGQTVRVSSATHGSTDTINVKGYSTISSQAKSAYSWSNASGTRYESILGSGNEYTWAYNWLQQSGSNLKSIVNSGNEYSWAHNWVNTSGSQLSALLQSGNEYTEAYQQRGSQIAGANLTWNGTQLDAAGGAGGAGGYPSGLSGDIQYKSGTSHGGQHQLHWGNKDLTFTVSGSIKGYSVSAQTLSGQIKAIHTAGDISGWNSAAWHNSSIVWDNALTKWKAYKSGAGGASDHGALTGLTDDDHTQYFNNTRLATLSGQTRDAYNWINASSQRYESILGSGNEYTWAYNWLNQSGSILNAISNSGNEYSWTYNWINQSGSSIKSIINSGNEYSNAYTWYSNSSQKLSWFIASGLTPVSDMTNKSSGDVLRWGGTYWSAQAVTATPAGGDNYVQYNDGGSSFGGDSSFTWNEDTDTLRISGSISGTTISGGTVRFNAFAGTTNATAAEIEELTDGSETTLHSHATAGGGTSYWSSQAEKSTGSIYYDAGKVVIATSGSDYGDYKLQVSGGTFFSGNTKFKGNRISGLTNPAWPTEATNLQYVQQNYYPSSLGLDNYQHSSNSGVHLTNTQTAPASGEVLVYKANNARWENELPPMTFNIANVQISANHNINLTRFDAGTKNVYVWQAAACNSGGTSISGLSIELLSGSTSVYKTSSATLQQGYPLAKSNGGSTEIRFMYSGTAALTGYQYGTGFMQVSIY